MGSEDQKGEHDQAIEGWIARFKKDSRELAESERLGVTRSFLSRFCGVTDEEFQLLADQNFTPSASDPENALTYANAEQKIERSFSSSFAEKGSRQHRKLLGKRRLFREDLKDVLRDRYKPAEVDEIFSLMNKNAIGMDDVYLVWTLVGKHPLIRRIRNAYLPAITTQLEVDVADSQITGVRDKTSSLFNDREEPVDTIDRLPDKK